MTNVVILAGDQAIRDWDHWGNKALIPINGKMMIEYVIQAVKNAGNIGKVVIVGPVSKLQAPFSGKVDRVIDSKGTILENLIEGIRYLGVDNHILVCSCDIPFITPQAINDFVIQSRQLGGDICYPIIEKSTYEKEFPEIERTYVKMREGVFTGGNIFYVNPEVVEKSSPFADKLLKARKNPFKMARLLGFGIVFHLLLGTLSIKKVEKRFNYLFGIEGKALIFDYPEVGNDVDRLSDIPVAAAYLDKSSI